MTEVQVIRRKIHLKRQAVQLIREDIKALRFRGKLLLMRADLEKQMTATFDQALSHKIDAVISLLDG